MGGKRESSQAWGLTSFLWGTRRHHTWSQEEQANCRSTAGMRSSWALWNIRRLASVRGNREVATACSVDERGRKGHRCLSSPQRNSLILPHG